MNRIPIAPALTLWFVSSAFAQVPRMTKLFPQVNGLLWTQLSVELVFTRAAAKQGVDVFCVTNRDCAPADVDPCPALTHTQNNMVRFRARQRSVSLHAEEATPRME